MTKRPHILRESIFCFILLTLGTAVVYGHVTLGIWQGRTPGQFDVRHYFVPMSFLFDFAIHGGELPEWNPLTFCGTPFAANPQTIVFYPPQLLRALLTPPGIPLYTYYSLAILIGLQSIGAGIGAYFLARSHKLGYIASFASALSFVFAVSLTRRVVALQFASALMWIPFLLICFHQMLRARSTPAQVFYCCGCGLLMGLSVLSGFVHLHAYVGVMLGAYWLASRLIGFEPRRGASFRSIPKQLLLDSSYVAGVAAIAVGVGAIMLIPAAEFAPHTSRTGEHRTDAAHKEYPLSVVRQAMLGPASAETEKPERAMGYRTAGLSVFLLALAGLLGPRKRAAFIHIVVFLALFDCTLGRPYPIASIVESISPFRMVSPARALVIGNLPLSIAVGFGVEALTTMARTQRARILRTGLILIGGITLLRLSTIPISDIAAQLLILIVLLTMVSNWIALPRLGPVIACTALFAECLVWNYRLLPVLTEKREFIDIQSHANVVTPRWDRNLRISDPAPNAHAYSIEPAVNGYDPLYIQKIWNLLAPPFQERNYDRILRAPDTVRDNPQTMLLLKRHFWLARQYVDGALPRADRLFPPTTTAFVQGAAALPIPEVSLDAVANSPVSRVTERFALSINDAAVDRHPAFQTPSAGLQIPDTTPVQLHRVLVLRYAAPCEGQLWVWMTGGEPESVFPIYVKDIASTGEREESLIVPLPDLTNAEVTLTFYPSAEACDIEWRQAELLVDQEDENGRIAIASRSFNSVRLAIGPLEDYRLLVFLDAFYPGWTATVDGKPAELLRVDDAFKGVVVGPGTHTVEFVFRSARIRWGMAVSTITLVVVCASVVWHFRSRRNRGDRKTFR